MKYWLLVSLISFPAILLATEEMPQIKCITYTMVTEPNGGELTYNEPEFFEFYKQNDVRTKTRKLTESTDTKLFMKMIDNETLLVVSNESRLNSQNPEFLMPLGKYVYVGQAEYNLLEDDTEVKLSALCYLAKDESRVPFIKNFNKMIALRITSLSEEKFNLLSKN